MPIDTLHAALSAQKNKVAKARAFTKGGGAEKAFVTKLPGQQDQVVNGVSEVDLFRDNTYYLGSVRMTLDAFTGMIMSPAPSIDQENESLKLFVEDMTKGGEPLNRCIARTIRQVLVTGRQFALVDWPQADPDQVKADAQSNNERAYAVFYKFEDLIDFRSAMIGGERRFTQIRVYEGYDVNVDEFTISHRKQIKVLDLVPYSDDAGARLIYRQRIFRQGNEVLPELTQSSEAIRRAVEQRNAEWRQWGDEVYPKKKGAFLEEIPCVFFGPSSLDPMEVDEAPLDNLVNIAASHLQNSALREWSLMWCGSTTLVLSGGLESDMDDDGDETDPEPIRVGSSEALQLGENGDAKLLQAGKEAVGAISETMREKQEHMAAAGAMLLTNNVQSNISRETALLMRVGQFATLSDVAMTTEEGYEKLIMMLLDWQGVPIPEELGLELNKEYVPNTLDGAEITALVAGIQAGEMPRIVLLDRMKKAGLIDPRMSEDEYKDKIASERDEFGTQDDGDETGEGGPAPGDEPPIEE